MAAPFVVVWVVPAVSSYHVQVQVEHVVHVAQQVQPPGAITTVLADVQVVPTFPVKRNIVCSSFPLGSACVDHHSSVVPKAELLTDRFGFEQLGNLVVEGIMPQREISHLERTRARGRRIGPLTTQNDSTLWTTLEYGLNTI
jgi:hypothetical protein